MRRWCIIFILFLAFACRKPFDVPASEETGTLLVVEGGIAVGDDAQNRFLLSRLRALDDTVISRPEPGAVVTVVSSSGSEWQLPEILPGEYSAILDIPATNDHKLRIVTASRKTYETPFLETVRTPEIDSVTWSEDTDVSLFVHTHDPSNATSYYKWDFTETWEYRSWFESFVDFVNGDLVMRPPDNLVYSCWRNAESNNILIRNTLGLSENRISYQPLHTLIRPEERLSQRYSILVRQYGLSREAYEFWSILRKNTELTGSLFDPQPSQLPGNITCLDDPGETVIGYVSSGEQTSMRIFIRNADLGKTWPREDLSIFCKETRGRVAAMVEVLKVDASLGPAYYTDMGLTLVLARKPCIDCRLSGGTNIKPSFW